MVNYEECMFQLELWIGYSLYQLPLIDPCLDLLGLAYVVCRPDSGINHVTILLNTLGIAGVNTLADLNVPWPAEVPCFGRKEGNWFGECHFFVDPERKWSSNVSTT